MAETIAIWLLTTFGTANAAGVVVVSMATLQATTTLVAFVALTAANMAANKLLAPKMPSFNDASLANRTQMVRSPIAARQIIYGETKASGVVVYISTTGTKNEYLHMVIALAGHEVEGIGDIYFNDELALSDPNYTAGSTAGIGRFAGYAEIYKKYGSSTQTVQTDLKTATDGLTNGAWTDDHRLRGIAYIYVRLVWNDQVWAGGIPNISAMVKGKKVYDPRSATTAYSANAALCLRDYLTDSTYGLGLASTEVDDTAFSVAANICDEQVEVKPVTIPATYENRYETNGVLYTSESPDGNIGKLLSAMGGLIAYSGGRIIPYAAGYRIPTVTLNDSDFAGPISVQTKTSARDRVNAVKGVFVSEKSEWQPTDFPPQTSATYLTQDNNVRYWRDVVLPMTTSSSAAQRLARIELFRARQEITFTARFRLDAMQVRAGDTVMVTLSKFGWSAKVFEVIEWHFVSDGNPPQLGIEMTLRETASSVYDWNVSDEVQVDTTPTTTLPDPFSLDAPTNLALTADGTTQLIQADGTALPRIKVAWSAPSEQFIQSGGQVIIEYKQGNATTYLTWSKINGDQVLDYISSDVRIGTTYDVRIYGQSYFGVSTSYVTAGVTVAKDTTAPAAPTSLTAAVGTGKAVSLDWADNTEPDLSEYGVYRNTTGVTPANASTNKIAEVRASRFVDTEVAIGTTYWYWVNAYDALENVSGFSAAVTAVPTYVNGGSVDPNAPTTPAAPQYVSETTYLASDGGSFARISLTAPPLSANAIATDILYRRSGANDWILGNQINSAVSYLVSIDDLTCGVTYEFASRAISNFGVLSSVSTTISRMAPNNTTAPNAPTNISVVSPSSTASVPPAYTSTGSQFYAALVTWTASTTKSVVGYQIGYSTSFGGSITWEADVITEPFYYHYTLSLVGEFISVRAVDRSGNFSSALSSSTNLNSVIKYPAGTISPQNSNDVQVTGIKTGGNSSTRQVNVIYDTNEVISITAGTTTVTVGIDISNRGFSAKPDEGLVVVEDVLYAGFYDSQDTGSTSTTAAIKIYRNDGGTLGTGNLRLSAKFTDYS
jgi:hypothetical protein